MKIRLPALALVSLLLVLPVAAQPEPTQVKTTKRSAVAIGSGSFALTPGTKLDVVARDGDHLVVKFRSLQGKVPLADTDYPPDAPVPAPSTAAVPAPLSGPAAKPGPAPAGPKATAAQPGQSAPIPVMNTTGTGPQPATNYGKAVQKAKQVTETQKSTRVDPTKDIMDEQPKK
jgi:hypothetical protein